VTAAVRRYERPSPEPAAGLPEVLTSGTYGRHGSLRRLGHGGRPVATLTFGTIGRIRLEGVIGE
jgi:hypothetical protein